MRKVSAATFQLTRSLLDIGCWCVEKRLLFVMRTKWKPYLAILAILTQIFIGFSQSLQDYSGVVSRLGHYHLISYLSQFSFSSQLTIRSNTVCDASSVIKRTVQTELCWSTFIVFSGDPLVCWPSWNISWCFEVLFRSINVLNFSVAPSCSVLFPR